MFNSDSPPHTVDDFHPLPFKYALVACYASLFIYAALRIHLHCGGHHSRRSFTFGLLTLVVIWGALRTCFWFATCVGPKTVVEDDSDSFFIVLKVVFYWIPFAMQFTSYSVFSLFLGKVVYRDQWKRDRCKTVFLTMFIVTNGILFVFVMAWATWSTMIAIGKRRPTHHNATYTPSSSPVNNTMNNTMIIAVTGGSVPWVPTHKATCEIQTLDAVLDAVMGSSFTILFLSFTCLTVKYFSLESQITQRMLVFRPKKLGGLCVIMSIVFLSRALVNFYNFNNELTGAKDDCNSKETTTNSKWNSLNLGSSRDETPWALVMALIWEIVPTMLILLTIAKREGRGSGGRGSGKHLHSNIPGGGYGAFNHDGSAASGNERLMDGGGWSASRDGGGGLHGIQGRDGLNGGRNEEENAIESAKRWLEGGDLFQDDLRYDSLPSDSNFDGHMIGRFGSNSAGGGSSYGKSYGRSYGKSYASSDGYGGLSDDSAGSEGGGVWGFGNKWNSPPGEMGRFGSLKVPSQLGPNRSVGVSTVVLPTREEVVVVEEKEEVVLVVEEEEEEEDDEVVV